MREKELRLAVVLTGGVSLAIFMHGVSRELKKLVRASKVLHSLPDAEARQHATYSALNDDPDRESDTEEIYLELLRAFAPAIGLRVVIDVIAGASAGGVNGVMLARALAHDLPLDGHRAMWLKHADAIELMDEKASAKRWSKLYMEPLTRILFRTWLAPLAPDEETRDKLRRFVRSRWFKPPFSGERFLGWLLDASDSMARGRAENNSLLPDSHALDLFVSLTDFHGHNRTIALHDPPRVVESEHLHLLHFHYFRHIDGTVRSDFDAEKVPGLVFAARATSSFPGAFPPATIGELDRVLAARQRDWPDRTRFLHDKFRALIRGGSDPAKAAFIDGSTVNDKPFAAAIRALARRPAHREVVRRLIYVDPDPETGAPVNHGNGLPGMFRTILAALVEIPGNEPVRFELERLAEVNRRIATVRHVIRLARPQVNVHVERIVGGHPPATLEAAQVALWRTTANEQAASDSGYAFESYFRLKILTVLGSLQRLVAALAERQDASAGAGAAEDVIELWLNGWAQGRLDTLRLVSDGSDRAAEIDFLRAFDVDFRVRRLRFVIRRLNELYGTRGNGEATELSERLDKVKAMLYAQLELVRQRWSAAFHPAESVAAAARLAAGKADAEDVAALMDGIAATMDLTGQDELIDDIFARAGADYLDPEMRRELVEAYVGFAFFDVLSFPMVPSEDLDEMEEVLIHRISPEDAHAFRRDGDPVVLKGASLRHFGAFFSRPYREHDYLWGRLIAADRLVDVVLDAAGGSLRVPDLDIDDLKARLYDRILDAEAGFLKANPGLVEHVRAQVPRSGNGRHGGEQSARRATAKG